MEGEDQVKMTREVPADRRPPRPSAALGLGLLLAAAVALPPARAGDVAPAWRQAPDELARLQNGQERWAFDASPRNGKPHFHPLASPDGLLLTDQAPADHPWHYGLWFSWKFVNGVNFWEQDRKTGRAQGTTRWTAPDLHASPDGSADITLALSYESTNGTSWLTEVRTLQVSAPDAEGGYRIDWTARFRVGQDPLLFDRTPMPGEPGGQVNGGYGGFSLRLAKTSPPLTWITAGGDAPPFEGGRARPRSPALQACLSDGGRTGSVALISHPDNTPGRSPEWYVVDTAGMRFCCAAILAPAPIRRAPGEEFALRYRVLVGRGPRTPEQLQAAARDFAREP
jgi:hypothetical protein